MRYVITDTRINYVDDNNSTLAEITFPEVSDGVYEINHTFVDDSLRGQGIAGRLVKMAAEQINRNCGRVTASCSYAKKWIDKNGIMPYIICHMVTSVDGMVTGDYLTGNTGIAAGEVYYEINREWNKYGFACGRVTMESSFTQGQKPDLSLFKAADISNEDHIAKKHDRYAVSFDRHGNVGWTEGVIHDEDSGYDGHHIIEVLCSDTPKEMLAYYQSIGVSYIFAGEKDIDLKTALKKLYSIFGITRLMLEGGSIINGAFQREGLINELSLVSAPIIADKGSRPLFDSSIMQKMELLGVKEMGNGIVWLRYRMI